MSPFTCLGGAYAYRKSCPTPSLQFSVFLTIFCEKHKDYKTFSRDFDRVCRDFDIFCRDFDIVCRDFDCLSASLLAVGIPTGPI